MSGITLAEVLARETREGDLYETLPDGRLRCYACGHCCPLPEGAIGVCKVRFNQGGRLLVPWGYVGGVQCDPIEKKPFFHALPGRARLQLRHARLRSPLRLLSELGHLAGAARSGRGGAAAAHVTRRSRRATPLRQQARVIVSTYNEPLITSEWAVAVFKEAKAAGLVTGYVSNGNGTPQVLEYLRPWVDLYKVDLKSFDDRHYRELGGRLAADSRHDPPAARDGVLGRDRHAAHSRLQRRARRDRAADGVRRERLAGHPVARDRVSRRLQDDRSGEHDRGDAARGRRHRPGERPPLRLCRQPPRARRRPRGHALRRVRRASSSRAMATTSAITESRPTAAARRAPRRFRAAGARQFDGQIASRPFIPGNARHTIQSSNS